MIRSSAGKLVETLYHVVWELVHVFFDHLGGSTVVVTQSEHIPRIQAAQATAHHVLRELVED